MLRYIARKTAYGLLVLVGVVMLVFLLFQGLGDPGRLVLGQTGDSLTQANIRKDLYLDQPKWKQFVFYLNDVSPVSVYDSAAIYRKHLHGFFAGGQVKFGIKTPYLRHSYQSRRDVGQILMEALPGTFLLASAAMLIAIVLGIPLGVLAATRRNTWMDNSAIFASLVGISAPSFFMGIVIAYVFGFLLSSVTGLHLTGNWFDIDEVTGQRVIVLRNLLLPAITLGIRPLAVITQLTRSAMLDVLDQDFIRTATAKGLQSGRVIWKHALGNALNPVVTAVSGWFAELLAGAFFVEYIFGWRGIGKITVDALEKLDFPVVMGSVLISACLFVVVNILADILYAVIDPRVRLD